MQLLLVHSDAELGDQLAGMVKEYTAHDCDRVGSDAAALDWGRKHERCHLLLTQLEATGIDGLALGASLSEIFPGLQILFFPPYPTSDRRLEVTHTKVFPEPIDGDAVLGAIERAETANAGAPDLFHVVDVIQMCALAQRSGAIQLVKESQNGLVFLRDGQLLHAETSANRGIDALFEMIEWQYVEFAYDPSVDAPEKTITVPWDKAMIEAVTFHNQQKNVASRRRA